MISRAILNIYTAILLLVVFVPTAMADMSEAERQQFQQLQHDVEKLKKQVQILSREQRLQPTTPPVIEVAPKPKSVSLGTIPPLGNPDAKVALIEFADYECPYCKRFYRQSFGSIKNRFIDSGKIMYVFRDLPAPNRPQALPAAIAARCAGEQGKYYEMQSLLFSHGKSLQKNSYVKFGNKLGLDSSKFLACLINNNQAERVKQDVNEAQSLGIRGTPTFYIGTVEGNKIVDPRQIVGALPYSYFKQALEKALK
jgi:protein-disulfide isomerase